MNKWSIQTSLEIPESSKAIPLLSMEEVVATKLLQGLQEQMGEAK
jgi:hypothetical protein